MTHHKLGETMTSIVATLLGTRSALVIARLHTRGVSRLVIFPPYANQGCIRASTGETPLKVTSAGWPWVSWLGATRIYVLVIAMSYVMSVDKWPGALAGHTAVQTAFGRNNLYTS